MSIAKETGDRKSQGGAYVNLGTAYHSLGDYDKAIELYELGISIAKETGGRKSQGCAYINLGGVYQSLGDSNKAIKLNELGLSIVKETGDRKSQGCAYINLGDAYRSLGDSNKAFKLYELGLSTAKETGNRKLQKDTYTNLGNAYESLGDSNKAIKLYELVLSIAKETGDRKSQGCAYIKLGNAYKSLGDSNKAIKLYELVLSIAKETGDRKSQGYAYNNLGNAYESLGDSNKAIKLYELSISIAKETGDRKSQGHAYSNLGASYISLGDLKKGIEYSKLGLSIAKETEDRKSQGGPYSNLGSAYLSLGDFNKAIELYELALSIAKETGNKKSQGYAYINLSLTYHSAGVSKKAIELCELGLGFLKETGNKIPEGMGYGYLSFHCFCFGQFSKAEEFSKSSIKLFEETRVLLQGKDEWKISFRDKHDSSYTLQCSIQLRLGHTLEALFTAEAGRAQALVDLMESHYGVRKSIQWSLKQPIELTMSGISNHISSPTLFLAELESDLTSVVNFWLIQTGQQCQFTIKEISENLTSLTYRAYEKIGVNLKVRCPNRSLDDAEDEEKAMKSKQDKDGALKTLYDVVIAPISPLIEGDELVLVPDRYSFLIPYAALVDQHSRYLSETLRIRLAPSLTCLRLLSECPEGYHSKSGALLVGNPCLETVRIKPWKNLPQLPGAEKEVKMIGQILNIEPLVGKNASKEKVLSGLSSVSLVHIAAHGCPDTGGILLSPNLASSDNPEEKDFLLTMADVLEVQLHAKLVVLSCCYSGQGAIKAEGVVGIARAFLGAGARSVIASLWAISDDATMEFMGHFYEHLVAGKSASKSLHQAMKTLRESGKFDAVKYWAPFVLIGDDVTMNFAQ